MPALPHSPATRRRCAIVGLGSRHELYRDAILRTHAGAAELVGLCDVNAGRLELSRERCRRHGAEVPVGYLAADFDRMLREQRPDTVIVTTVSDVRTTAADASATLTMASHPVDSDCAESMPAIIAARCDANSAPV